jgi:hypothetical protein
VEKARFPLLFFLGIPAAIGFFLGWMGAGEASQWPRTAAINVWVVLSIGGWFAAHMGTSLFARLLGPRGWPLTAVLALGVITSGMIAVPFNYLVGELFSQVGFATKGLEALATYSPERALDALVGPLLLWTVVNLIIARVREQPHYGYPWKKEVPEAPLEAAPVQLASPKFLTRVRPAVRGDVLALQAELHYVRVFTARGEDLILYRFSDAVEEMGEAGLQVHRSWWISREAAIGGGRSPRPYLLLSNGTQVPVSRSRISECRPLMQRTGATLSD